MNFKDFVIEGESNHRKVTIQINMTVDTGAIPDQEVVSMVRKAMLKAVKSGEATDIDSEYVISSDVAVTVKPL